MLYCRGEAQRQERKQAEEEEKEGKTETRPQLKHDGSTRKAEG
jgi:hypothetical protein